MVDSVRISSLMFQNVILVIFNYFCSNMRCVYCISPAKYLYNCGWILYLSREKGKKYLFSLHRHKLKLLLANRETKAFYRSKIRNNRPPWALRKSWMFICISSYGKPDNFVQKTQVQNNYSLIVCFSDV